MTITGITYEETEDSRRVVITLPKCPKDKEPTPRNKVLTLALVLLAVAFVGLVVVVLIQANSNGALDFLRLLLSLV